MRLKGKHLEYLYMIIIFGALIWVGVGTLWDHKLEHDFPYGYLASDAFQHQVRAESIKNMGNYKNEAFYAVKGSNVANVIGFYPALSHHLAVLLSYASGLETYDTMYFIVFLGPLIGAMVMYFIIRRFNKTIALISLPFAFLMYARNNFLLLTWGHWPTFIGHFFLILCFWAMLKLKLKRIWLVLGLFMSALFLTHTSEFMFIVLFVVFFFIVDLIKTKRINWVDVRKVVFSGLVFLVISLYYLIIFKGTWAVSQGIDYYSGLFSMKSYGNDPFVFIGFFKWLWLILIIGMLVGLLILLKEKDKWKVVLLGFFMFLISYGNYLGLERHALRTRALWGIYLSIFFGIGVYYALKFLVKSFRKEFAIGLGLFFFLILSGMVGAGLFSKIIPVSETSTAQGIMNKEHWDAMRWISRNAEKESRVYFFYGDSYEQDAQLRNVERAHFLAVTDDLIQSLQNRTIKRYYLTERPGDTGGLGSPYRKSFFKFGFALDETDEYETRPRDVCEFDYYIFDKASNYYPILAQYNMLIGSKLIENDFIEPIYANELVVILKNNKPGEDCIVEGTFE